MSATTERPSAVARLGRSAMGERLGGFIYGTIVALSVVVAGAKAYPDGPGHVAALVAVTCLVFWIAHVYAHALGHSAALGEHLSLAELRRIGRREWSIVEAAVPSIVALLLGGIGLLEPRTAVWLAVALGLVVLGAQGIVFARVERLGLTATVGVVALNLSLGVLLVGLKLLISH
ncbi:MAG TPA: hypothetical protein VJ419_00505 [Gaiellaceae bacterium]|nr:hypothetical protein [Gaiellaceae bacterium]